MLAFVVCPEWPQESGGTARTVRFCQVCHVCYAGVMSNRNPHAYRNPDAFRAHVERARTSAAGKHARKGTQRLNTRGARIRHAVADSY